MQNPRARASRVALSPRARLQSPLIAPAPHNPRGPCPCPGTADADTREALPWVSQLAAARHTRATCYVLTSATKQPAAARAGGGPGEPLHPAWILPVLPRRVAPLLRCLTQSRGDETPAPQPRRWPAPWGAAGGGHPARRGLLGRGLRAPRRGPQPYSLLPGVSGLHSAEGLGRSWSCGLEASHLGRKVKRARAPHRREHTHNGGLCAISLVPGKCTSKPSTWMAKNSKTDTTKNVVKNVRGLGG